MWVYVWQLIYCALEVLEIQGRFSWRWLTHPPDINRQNTAQPKDGKIHFSIPAWELVLAPGWSHIRSQKDLLSKMAGEDRLSRQIQRLGHKLVRFPNLWTLWSDFLVRIWQGTSLFSWTLMKLSEVARRDGDREKWKTEHSGISANISIFIGTSNQFVPHSCFIRICTKAPPAENCEDHK